MTSITISAEQAALVEAEQPFAVDGEGRVVRAMKSLDPALGKVTADAIETALTHAQAQLGEPELLPPAEWLAADKPCPIEGCEDGWIDAGPTFHDPLQDPFECETCHGTGRTVIELVANCQRCKGMGAHSDRVNCQSCDPPASGKHLLGLFTIEVLPIKQWGSWAMNSRWINADTEGFATLNDSNTGDVTAITLPPDAHPGQYAVVATKVET